MSDHPRRYRAIHEALRQWYPGEPSGSRARHLTTLAALISGIVASRSSQLPQIALKVPDSNKPGSRIKRYTRWMGNESVTENVNRFILMSWGR
jgi:hypothetical protein